MGKETQLLEAAAAGNNNKVEQLLQYKSKLKRIRSSEKNLDSIDELEQDAGLQIREKKKVSHLEIDVRDSNGASPLIIAALNGHRDVVHTLLSYSANILAVDDQGNSALHFAAWHNRSDIVELLLANDAVTDAVNKAGNTPLHYACQYSPPGKTLTIVKILQCSEASILRQNKTGDTPFSLAVRFKKREAVSLLVDAEPKLLKETRYIVEAAKSGCTDIVEALLEAGVDPNCFDGISKSCPLHEAVRFFRKATTKVLLEFGAACDQTSPMDETPINIVKQHPEGKREEFIKLFLEYRGKTARIPKAYMEKTQASAENNQNTSVCITYPLLKNKVEWTRAEPEFCSAWTKLHPNTCLLDDDPSSYWKIPAAGAYIWVAFDLGSEYTLTGLRLAGWDDKQMVHAFIIEVADALSGPWKQVQKFKADCIGHDDMTLLSIPQDFKGFYESSRYWKMVVAGNYGAPTTCLAEIQFFGVENRVTDWFEKIGIKQHLKEFVQRGYNQLSDLALMTKADINDSIKGEANQKKVLHAISVLREECFPPKNMNWAVKPASKVTANKPLPEFIVYSAPYSVGNLKLVVKGGAILGGKTVQHLSSRQNGYPSRCSFKDITIGPPGQYLLQVVSTVDSRVVLQSEPLTVIPAPMRESEIGLMFDDFDKMLQF